MYVFPAVKSWLHGRKIVPSAWTVVRLPARHIAMTLGMKEFLKSIYRGTCSQAASIYLAAYFLAINQDSFINAMFSRLMHIKVW
jgi:hypothetical protein